ncbi:MAG: hypothetical protein K9H84_06505 [Bacteroidales bacterium]|nr:hypothetical protein [Bacteroidales bacterium]
MEQKFKYEFDPETGIFYKYYYGPIQLIDIYESWEYIFSTGRLPQKNIKGFILDYREATFNMEINDYKKIAKYYQNNLDKFGGYKFAIITENAKDIVFPTLVSTQDSGYQSKPFSTLQGAKSWLLD